MLTTYRIITIRATEKKLISLISTPAHPGF